MTFAKLDAYLIAMMRRWGIPLLRSSLGIVFLWFGALKVIGVSPVTDLILNTYSFLPPSVFILFLGIWEMVIGLGLLMNRALRVILALLWIQMAGTLLSPLFNPALFWQSNNPLFLTMAGEFLVKNFVLIAAGIVIGGYLVFPKDQE